MLQNPTNPSCIDLILTNRPRSFQNSCTFETGLSDFLKMTLTVLKSSFAKQKPRILNYRNYNSLTSLQRSILYKLINSNLQISNKDLKHFKETCLSVVNTIAPLKSRFIRANQAPFINKEVQRGVMVRSKLRKKFLKSRSKSGKKHTINIENISLIENGNLLNDDFEIVQTFNKYFQNLIPLIQLLKYQATYFAKHQKTVMKFYPRYTNTRIIQASKQSSKNAILAFLSKHCHLLIQKRK